MIARQATLFVVAACVIFGQARTRELVRRDNVTIEVIAEGRGPLIVMLPSLGRDSEEFDPAAKRIAAAGFRVLRPQPRGYGRSVGPMENLTLHDLAQGRRRGDRAGEFRDRRLSRGTLSAILSRR